jgi:hypothetical protein
VLSGGVIGLLLIFSLLVKDNFNYTAVAVGGVLFLCVGASVLNARPVLAQTLFFLRNNS